MIPAVKWNRRKYSHSAKVSKSKINTCICPSMKLLRRGTMARNINNPTCLQFKSLMRVRSPAISNRKTRLAASQHRFAWSGGSDAKGRMISAEGSVNGIKVISP